MCRDRIGDTGLDCQSEQRIESVRFRQIVHFESSAKGTNPGANAALATP
jgi:hypothetical protein